MDKFSLSLVFPAYNEAVNLEDLVSRAFESVKDIVSDFEIIIVDDGSTDNTIPTLDSLKAKFGEKLRSIHLRPNKGYASALREGFLNAKKDFIFYSDADNQFDLNEITLLFEHMDTNDLVVGYRKDRQDNFLRIFLARGFNLIARTIFGLKVRDIDCAFKLFKREVFEKIKINDDNYLLDTEILAKAKKFNMSLKEVGVTHLPRQKGSSTVKPSAVFVTLYGLAKLAKDLRKIS